MLSMQTAYDEMNKVWSGPKRRPMYDFDCSIGRFIFVAMRSHPQNICQISDTDDISLTNKEALGMGIRLAQHFKKLGLNHDDVIGITGRNSSFVMPLGVGCLMNCTPFHAVNPIYDEKTFKHLFGLTKPKLIFCDGQEYAKIKAATEQFKPTIYTLTDHLEGVPKIMDLLAPTKTELLYSPENLVHGGNQTMAILCSSGTTGLPKAVCISNHSFFYDNIFFTSDDIIINFSGLDWISGALFFVLSTTVGCKRIITTKPYSPEYFIELVQKYKATVGMAAPRHVAALLNCPLATTENLQSIKLFSISGGTVGLPLLKVLQGILKTAYLNFGYGITEIGAVAGNVGLAKGTSVGNVCTGYRVRIVNDVGENVGHNEVGEIYVHTGHGWNGYFGNKEETARMQDQDGWFHTGDLGYLDEDNFLFVVDRKKEILKWNGMHYWPTEIEDAICELPEVQDACVIGMPDALNGDAAGALVVIAEGSKLSAEDIKEHVRNRLVLAHKHLNSEVFFVEKLPQNSNGKILKKEAKVVFEQLMKG